MESKTKPLCDWVKPLDDWVFIKPDESPDVSDGGIIVPEMAKKKSCRGTVVACGKGIHTPSGFFIKMPLKVGDRILYNIFVAEDINIEGQNLKQIKENGISAIIFDQDVSHETKNLAGVAAGNDTDNITP